MGIVLKQYDGADVTPKDDALLYDFLIGQSGVVEGCTVTHLGANQLQVAAGWGVIKGRIFVVAAETILAQVSDSGTKRGRLYIEIDIANTSTPIAIKTTRATTLPALVQEDINRDGSVYQLALVEYDISTTMISNITNVVEIVTGWAGALDGKANVNHNHNASAINAGTLPIDRGGTGATTAAGARTNLGLKNGALAQMSYSNGTLTITL
jgi:hypothetical protein